jgi:hypothetical protein
MFELNEEYFSKMQGYLIVGFPKLNGALSSRYIKT